MITENDKALINETLKKMKEAWAAGDGAAYGSQFLENARYVEAPGTRVIGAKVIGERHQKIFDTFFKGTRIDGKYPSEIQVLTPDVVIIHSEGTVYFPGEDGKKIPPNGLMSACLVKRDNEWKIASFQNTPTGRFRMIKFFLRFTRSGLYALGRKRR